MVTWTVERRSDRLQRFRCARPACWGGYVTETVPLALPRRAALRALGGLALGGLGAGALSACATAQTSSTAPTGTISIGHGLLRRHVAGVQPRPAGAAAPPAVARSWSS